MLGKSFGVKYLTAAAVVLLLAACAAPKPEVTAPAPKPEKAAPAMPAQPQPEVTAEPIEQGPVPGTQEELNATIGDRVFFAYDRYDLSPEARTTLRRQAQWLLAHANVNVTIEGHCDERGTREYNLALGDRRATAAKNFLVALGVDASRITTISYGKERPAVLGSNEAAWAKNRRAVMVVK